MISQRSSRGNGNSGESAIVVQEDSQSGCETKDSNYNLAATTAFCFNGTCYRLSEATPDARFGTPTIVGPGRRVGHVALDNRFLASCNPTGYRD